jgi:nucleoside-diphosphate-sugar epimerase
VIFIIGGQGFVGSAYPRLFKRLGLDHQVITRDNFDQFAGQPCDVLINANGNSKKFMADRDPVWEFDASVVSVAKALEAFKAKAYIHLSTGDVYPETHSPEVSREDQLPDVTRMSRYGLHKYIAETLVRGAHDNHLIMRMGGFVGPNLKKNAVYDMLNDAPIWLHRDSELQFISTDSAAEIVWTVFQNGARNETVNLGARGVVKIGDLFDRLKPKSEFQPDAKPVRFEISVDKLETLYGAPLPESRAEVDAFLTAQGR